MMISSISDRHSVTDPRNTVTPPHGLSNECACGKPAVIAFDNRSWCYECSHRARELPESISTADRSRAYRKRVSRGKVQFTIEVTPGEHNALVRSGYLAADDYWDHAAVVTAIEAALSDTARAVSHSLRNVCAREVST